MNHSYEFQARAIGKGRNGYFVMKHLEFWDMRKTSSGTDPKLWLEVRSKRITSSAPIRIEVDTADLRDLVEFLQFHLTAVENEAQSNNRKEVIDR